MEKITSIRITKSTHREILKVMGKIQAKTGEIPTLDDALQELLENYKKKSRRWPFDSIVEWFSEIGIYS